MLLPHAELRPFVAHALLRAVSRLISTPKRRTDPEGVAMSDGFPSATARKATEPPCVSMRFFPRLEHSTCFTQKTMTLYPAFYHIIAMEYVSGRRAF